MAEAESAPVWIVDCAVRATTFAEALVPTPAPLNGCILGRKERVLHTLAG